MDQDQYSQDDIQYALESTRILYEPYRRIDTFGGTRFKFLLISEPMDQVGMTRVRNGWVEAEKPKIIKPEIYNQINTEGFGEDARRFFSWLSQHTSAFKALLQYGFEFRRSDVSTELIHEPEAQVSGRLVDAAKAEGEPLLGIISGVDDAWEVCLLKFTIEMVQKSHEINLFDFKRKGLL